MVKIMKKSTLLSLCCVLLLMNCNSSLLSDPGKTKTKSEAYMDMVEFVKFHGYPVEVHDVTTEDGYILRHFRIPYGLKNTNEPRPAVILQHGLIDSSFTWVNNGPKKSLGFILADSGFDVWLSNSRGNMYSRRHIKYSPASLRFWNFTWDQMAKYDLPATINYALKTSKVSKLGYVGHSQGGGIGLVAFSNNDDLKTKISAYVGLAPATYLGHMRSPLKLLAPLSPVIGLVHNLLFAGEFQPNNELITSVTQLACGNLVGSLVCKNVVFLLLGPSIRNLNGSRLPIYLSHFPAGTSAKNFQQYLQLSMSRKYRQYNYGVYGNMKHYGQRSPPEYTLDTRPVPTAIFYGGNDWLIDPKDIEISIEKLGPAVTFTKYIPEYNHMDFLWGMDAFKVVFPDVIDFLNKYNQ